MILMRLVLLAVIASLSDADESPESYLLYAVENGGSVHFHLTDLDFKEKKYFQVQNGILDNIYLSKDERGLIVYWNYKNSPLVGRYVVSTNDRKIRPLSNENVVFLGLGYDDQIYLYSPKSKTITVYGNDLETKIMESGGLENYTTDMHCVDIDTRNREQIVFVECTDKETFTSVYDISVKGIPDGYKQQLSTCFETLRITPNGQKAYAVSGNKIFLLPSGGIPFAEALTAGKDIVGFAAGNSDIFYSSVENKMKSKIFKVTPSRNVFRVKGHLDVKGAVKLLAVYTPPKRYLIYAVENDNKIHFYKTDLDLGPSTRLFTADIYGDGFDKMYLAYHDDDNNDEALYWSYKNSRSIWRYGLSTNSLNETYLTEYFGTLVGIGNDNDMYFYSASSDTFTVYNFMGGKNKSLTFEGTKGSSKQCFSVDPRSREMVWFAECKESTKTRKLLFVAEMGIPEDYNQILDVCFDSWGITPNGKHTYAVKGAIIFLSSKHGDPFETFRLVGNDIEHFAIGNNELFYTTKLVSKIFKKSTVQGLPSYLEVDGKIKALALHQE